MADVGPSMREEHAYPSEVGPHRNRRRRHHQRSLQTRFKKVAYSASSSSVRSSALWWLPRSKPRPREWRLETVRSTALTPAVRDPGCFCCAPPHPLRPTGETVADLTAKDVAWRSVARRLTPIRSRTESVKSCTERWTHLARNGVRCTNGAHQYSARLHFDFYGFRASNIIHLSYVLLSDVFSLSLVTHGGVYFVSSYVKL